MAGLQQIGSTLNAGGGGTPPDLSSYQQKLTGNTTYYVSSTGSDTNIGSQANPFLTLDRAIEEFNKFYIPEGVEAKIRVTDPIVSGSAAGPVELSHTGKIVIEGEDLISRNVTGIVGLTVVGGGFSSQRHVEITLDDTSGIEVGNYILIESAANGTNPWGVIGAHRIVATTATTITFFKDYNSVSQPSGAVTASCQIMASSVRFQDLAGTQNFDGLLVTGTRLTLKNIALSNGNEALTVESSQLIEFDNFAIDNTGIPQISNSLVKGSIWLHRCSVLRMVRCECYFTKYVTSTNGNPFFVRSYFEMRGMIVPQTANIATDNSSGNIGGCTFIRCSPLQSVSSSTIAFTLPQSTFDNVFTHGNASNSSFILNTQIASFVQYVGTTPNYSPAVDGGNRGSYIT